MLTVTEQVGDMNVHGAKRSENYEVKITMFFEASMLVVGTIMSGSSDVSEGNILLINGIFWKRRMEIVRTLPWK